MGAGEPVEGVKRKAATATELDAEDIKETLLRAADLRAKALLELAKTATPAGIVGWTEGENPRPIMFPAYELQSLLRVVTEVTTDDTRSLAALSKMSPEAVAAAVAKRAQLRGESDAAGDHGNGVDA